MSPVLQDEEIIAGPLKHPRHGTCLEVHPTKEAQRPGRYPSQAVVVTTAARRMIELSKGGQKLESILVIGDDIDPVAHPEFREISENLRELSDKWFPKAKMVLETDPQHLETPDLRHALSSYDQPLLQFASGTQKGHQALTGEKGPTLKAAVENMSRVEHEGWILDARFVRGSVDNSTDAELRAWLTNISKSRPSAVTIWTPAKASTQNGVKTQPVPKTKMQLIAESVTEKTGIAVEILDVA